MSFKNMKIPVENNLDEIVAELERLGFTPCMQAYWSDKWVATNGKTFAVFCADMWVDWKLTTLAELKEM